MEEPLDPGIPSRLGHKRAGRAREWNAAAATAVELPWRLRPELFRKGQRERCRGSGCFPCPPVGCRCAAELDPVLAPQLGGPVTPARRDEEPGAEPLPPTGSQQPVGKDSAPLPSAEPGGTGLKFGLLAPELHSRLLDQEDYRNRMQAVEELKRVVEDASQAAVTSVPAPSVLGFISLLCTLLGDFNFKVVLGALEVIYLLALRLDNRVKAFVTPLFSAAAKVLGDSKLAIRQGYRRLLRWLMKAVGPQQVLDLLLQQEYRQNKNSRVREEVINMCIVALLTYPSEELDLAKLAFQLAPALVDNKHRVRHAAMEAFAVLASAMGPGKTALLFKAVDAVELKDNGDGLMRAVQARLARKILPKLADQGFVEYAVPLPSSYHNRESCLPPGADTDWLLMCDRTRSAHSYCGCVARVDALQHSSSHGADANQVACSRKILNAYKGENKLPWENKHAEYKEVGSGDKMPVTQGVEQFPTSSDLLHFPELRPSQGVPVSDELHFSRKRTSGNFIQNSIDFKSEHSSVRAGPVGSRQPQISGKCGTLGHTQTREKSGCTSLNFSNKTQRSFYNQAENTLPFQGENLQEKHAPLQLKPTLVRQQVPCRCLNGTKPIPPIPRLLPDKLNSTKCSKEECKDMRLNQADRKLAAADLSELNVDGEEVDQEEMKNSLRSLRNTAAKKRAVLKSNISGLGSPQSALKLDLSGGSPSHVSCPSVDAHSKSGVYSQDCLTSPMPTVLHRRRRMSDNFLLLGRKSQTARTFSARNRDPNVAEHNTSTACPAFGDNVRTVGQCFSCGNGCGDYADKKQDLSRTAFQSQNTEHQRNYKHSKDEISLKAQGNYKGKRPPGTGAMDKSELGPFSKPETALTEALTLLADDHWEKKIEGLNLIRCLSAYHATTLTAKLHETSMAVAQEVKNLRSGVSRAAVICLGDLFTYLKKSMDRELDYTVKSLLHKAGESNTFIREEADKALKAMVNNVTPARALCSLIDGGQRYYGRKMLFRMMTHPDFDKALEKYVLTKDLPCIREAITNLRKKGLDRLPSDKP